MRNFKKVLKMLMSKKQLHLWKINHFCF